MNCPATPTSPAPFLVTCAGVDVAARVVVVALAALVVVETPGVGTTTAPVPAVGREDDRAATLEDVESTVEAREEVAGIEVEFVRTVYVRSLDSAECISSN